MSHSAADTAEHFAGDEAWTEATQDADLIRETGWSFMRDIGAGCERAQDWEGLAR